MIARLHGKLISKEPPQLIIDCHGVGYLVSVPMSTFYHLPATGQDCTLLMEMLVREDAHLLFGFITTAERDAFRALLKISGIGPKVALAVLSGLSVAELNEAVLMQDLGRFTRIPGIGKKTAERLLLELKGKFGSLSEVLVPGTPSAHQTSASISSNHDVLNALLSLGYSDKEALLAVKTLPAELGVSEGIRQALKTLAK
jgi:Holliday junction DNA helicase RuvA